MPTARDNTSTNGWRNKTRNRIRDLIAPGGINSYAGLVLANAIYLKARWESEFLEERTRPSPFHVRGGAAVDVPTMNQKNHIGYAKYDGYAAVALPYMGEELQFVILLPSERKGLHALEKKLNAGMLARCAKLEKRELHLSLPRFKIQPPTIALSEKLQALGMKSAFDVPRGSANFDNTAPRKPDDYLAISEVFHKTFIVVYEKGTEAAAATAIIELRQGLAPQPVVVNVDHPFLYAIQHVPSGACLFLGRVTDPR
jgi:serpin B